MSYKVFELLRKYKYLGERILEDGTLLIGKAPHIAPLAWLHSIYPALKSNEIEFLETKLGTSISLDYKRFLTSSNGLGVFNTTFSLYGLRRNYNRTIDDVWQPFNIITPNTLEKPDNAKRTDFIIGGYDWDGSRLYIDTETNVVHLCDREDITTLYRWESFDKMLESEIHRLVKLFDSEGKEIDETKSTLPI